VPADPAVRARVARLLDRGPLGGWLPPAEPEASWSPPASAPEPPVAPADAVLPATVRGARVDPGRRGALALVLVCALAALVAGGVVLRGRPQEVAVPVLERAGLPLPGAPSSTPSPGGQVVVAVAGTVVRPGLVRLPTGSRVDDAVRAAGGLAPGASLGLLNLARPLVDGEQVLVGVDAPAGDAGGQAGAPGGLLDLNAATAEDLQDLPGIGPVLAERIVDWRTENGRFQSVDQLREVSGIGEAKFGSLEPEVTVR
jgi:competence protein ComEA